MSGGLVIGAVICGWAAALAVLWRWRCAAPEAVEGYEMWALRRRTVFWILAALATALAIDALVFGGFFAADA